MQRYRLTVEYDGTNYCGFQKQNLTKKRAVETVLEEAIFKFSQETPKICVCGRTDAGVHALGQVIHFDLKKKFESYRMLMGLNNYLRNENISIINCQIINTSFHARLSAKMRHYQYIIINRQSPLTIEKKLAHHIAKKLNINMMKESAKFLIGKHDFSSFRDAECQSPSPIRTIEKITIKKSQQNKVIIDISAKSFLHHMVRNIVGTLIWVGTKKIEPQDMKKILEAKNRTKSGPNAPAHGLYFVKVDY